MDGDASVTCIRSHLMVLLQQHGISNDEIRQDALNKSATTIWQALNEAWWMGAEKEMEEE